MENLRIRKNSYDFPGSWEELLEGGVKKYKGFTRFLGGDTTANRSAALCYLVKNKSGLIRDLRSVAHIERAEGGGNVLWQILRALDWAFLPREIGDREEIAPNIEGFNLGIKRERFLFPQKGLYDVTIGEWMYIDIYLKKYIKTEKRSDLLLLLATMARPSKSKKELSSESYDGYPRISFNPETIEKRARSLKKAPDYVLHACVDFASRGAQYLKMRYAPMFEGNTTKGGRSYGWEGIITSLAESGVFGDEREVRLRLIHKTCRYFCMKLEQQKKHKAKLESIRGEIIA